MVKSSLVAATIAAVKNSPREIFNLHLLYCVLIWSFSGVAKGFDEGKFTSMISNNYTNNLFADNILLRQHRLARCPDSLQRSIRPFQGDR